MNRTRYRWLPRAALFLCGGLGLLAWSLTRHHTLIIENRAGQTVAFLQLTISGKTSKFEDLTSGATVSTDLDLHAGDRFSAEGRLVDRTQIRVNGTVGEWDRFVLLPNGEVRLESRNHGMQ